MEFYWSGGRFLKYLQQQVCINFPLSFFLLLSFMIFQELLKLYFRHRIFTFKNANIIIQGFASECAEPASPSDALKGCQHYKSVFLF